MKYAPSKVFILENGNYVDTSYKELCQRTEKYKTYEDKLRDVLYDNFSSLTDIVVYQFAK